MPSVLLLNACSIKKINSTNQKACNYLAKDLETLNIDIGIITETFLRPSVPDSYVSIDGYKVIRRDRKVCYCRNSSCTRQHRGGGIMIYIRDLFAFDIVSMADEVESLWIKVIPPNSLSPIFINASYHPPNAKPQPLIDFLSKTSDEIYKLCNRTNIIIGGDFNKLPINDLELECGVSKLKTPPTRGDAVLDFILTNRPDLIQSAECVTPSLSSDHLAVIMKPIYRVPPTRHKVTFTDFCFKGFRKLHELLTACNFNDVIQQSSSDLNKAAELMEFKLRSCITNAFPLRVVSMSDRDPAWITPKAKWLLLKKKKALNKRQFNSAEAIDQHLNLLKRKNLCRNPSKAFWNRVDIITHRKVSNNSISYNEFDSIQLNIDLASRSSRDSAQRDFPSFTVNNQTPPKISVFEVANALHKCKKTAPGPSDIPSFVFRDFFDILAPIYHTLWNRSLEIGIFPSIYKRANLIPLPKDKNSSTADQIRGISVTPIAARLFEKVVHNKWILPNIVKLGDPLQFAYKPHLSTIDCLLTLQHYILHFLDNSHIDGVHVVLLDFSKAFDRIKQENVAVMFPQFLKSPHLCQWLYDFISNRCQRLIWLGKPLPYLPIDLGCSQGTVGGPNIFSIFSDDIRAKSDVGKVLKYSDDTTILYPCLSDPNEHQKTAFQSEINNLRTASVKKGLNINNKKTKTIRFCLNKQPFCRCTYDSACYEEVTVTNILGIRFQSSCEFTLHRRHLIRQLKRCLYIIKDLKLQNMSTSDINKVFDSLVLSRIRYGISIYGSDTNSLRKIDAFLDTCHTKKYCSKRHYISDLLRSEDQRILQSILSNPNHPLLPFLSTDIKQKSTRHGYTHLKPRTRTKTFLNSFCNRVRPF